jgi:Tol biopolymer transport system component
VIISQEEHLVLRDSGVPVSASLDERFLLYQRNGPKTAGDLWALPLEGEQKPFPVVQTTFDKPAGQFSPDGRWIAYQSNESGQFETYIRSFPVTGEKWEMSTRGGTQPRWRHNGKELYYVAPDARLMAVSITASADGWTRARRRRFSRRGWRVARVSSRVERNTWWHPMDNSC